MFIIDTFVVDIIDNNIIHQIKKYKMRIVIPSNDNISISQHFGRSKGFTICEVKDGEIVDRRQVKNTFTDHVKNQHHEVEHHHSKEAHGNHSHEGIFRSIGDCQVVIAGGMGKRLYNDFKQRNVEVFITKEQIVNDALEAFISRSLDNNPDKCCNH